MYASQRRLETAPRFHDNWSFLKLQLRTEVHTAPGCRKDSREDWLLATATSKTKPICLIARCTTCQVTCLMNREIHGLILVPKPLTSQFQREHNSWAHTDHGVRGVRTAFSIATKLVGARNRSRSRVKRRALVIGVQVFDFRRRCHTIIPRHAPLLTDCRGYSTDSLLFSSTHRTHN